MQRRLGDADYLADFDDGMLLLLVEIDRQVPRLVVELLPLAASPALRRLGFRQLGLRPVADRAPLELSANASRTWYASLPPGVVVSMALVVL
jgi:hypothetical protein